jgi:hypothetical protein
MKEEEPAGIELPIDLRNKLIRGYRLGSIHDHLQNPQTWRSEQPCEPSDHENETSASNGDHLPISLWKMRKIRIPKPSRLVTLLLANTKMITRTHTT